MEKNVFKRTKYLLLYSVFESKIKMEDNLRSGCSWDVPVNKKVKRENKGFDEEVEELYEWVTVHCEKL